MICLSKYIIHFISKTDKHDTQDALPLQRTFKKE